MKSYLGLPNFLAGKEANQVSYTVFRPAAISVSFGFLIVFVALITGENNNGVPSA
jgi:hypothetical protein